MGNLMREADVGILPLRKKNSLRPVPPFMAYMQHAIHKIVETSKGTKKLKFGPSACYGEPKTDWGSCKNATDSTFRALIAQNLR
jgi:hypothetical protein